VDARRHGIQHNDIQHKGLKYVPLSISDTRHRWHSVWQCSVIMPSIIVLSVSFYLLLSWRSLCWTSLCWASLCWASLRWMSWRRMRTQNLKIMSRFLYPHVTGAQLLGIILSLFQSPWMSCLWVRSLWLHSLLTRTLRVSNLCVRNFWVFSLSVCSFVSLQLVGPFPIADGNM
jgi:hypothetical protein